MTLPPPPPQHRLEAATSRFGHQLKRTKAYLDTVLPCLRPAQTTESDANLQYLFQTLILMLHTFIEEYYRTLISLATLWRSDEVRAHLASRHVEKTDQIEEMTVAQLTRFAQEEVSFRGDAKKIKAMFAVLFSVGPFADGEAEAKCLDLVRIRNAITHQGGLVDEHYVTQLSSSDAAIKSTTSGSLVFYRLDIHPQFLADALGALSRSFTAIDESLRNDSRYAL